MVFTVCERTYIENHPHICPKKENLEDKAHFIKYMHQAAENGVGNCQNFYDEYVSRYLKNINYGSMILEKKFLLGFSTQSIFDHHRATSPSKCCPENFLALHSRKLKHPTTNLTYLSDISFLIKNHLLSVFQIEKSIFLCIK